MQTKIARVILGTILFHKPSLEIINNLVLEYPDRIIAALDVKNNLIATHGWQELSKYSIFEWAEQLLQLGFKRVLVTDISTDGTMKGPNIELYQQLSKEFPLKIIASGGVSNLDDIKALEQTGVEAVIVGKALYTGNIELQNILT